MTNAIFWDVTPYSCLITDVSEEHTTYIIRVARIGELGTLAVTSSQSAMPRNTSRRYVSPKHLFLTRVTRHNIAEDGTLETNPVPNPNPRLINQEIPSK
jgi:demethoxyubiquinone hydroxylase (CLK1/Coq7/Cat5 family)